MLLRASRASRLVKEALLGKILKKTWKPLAGAGLTAAVAGPQVMDSVRKSQIGLSQPYLEASRAGVVPSIPK